MLSLGAFPVGVDRGSRVFVRVHVHMYVRVRVLSFRTPRGLRTEDQRIMDQGSRIKGSRIKDFYVKVIAINLHSSMIKHIETNSSIL